MKTSTGTTEAAIADYVARCEVHLADVPWGAREQLRHDIEEVVAEVCAELDGAPDDLVGQPERFVRELRLAAGFPPPPERAAAETSSPSRSASVLGWLRRLWTHPAVVWTRALLPSLRPAWWVARGALVVTGFAWLTGGPRSPEWVAQFVPYWPIFGSRLLGIAGLCAGVYFSVEASRRRLRPSLRLLRVAASVAAIAFALVLSSEVRGWAHRSHPTMRASVSPPFADEAGGPPSFSVVQIGSDRTGTMVEVIDIDTARQVVSELLDDSPPAALFVEIAGQRVHPGTVAEIDEVLAGLAARGHLNGESPPPAPVTVTE